jgi:hypothetical protein
MIPGFTAESSVYNSTNAKLYGNTNVKEMKNIRKDREIVPAMRRSCARYCTGSWSDCLGDWDAWPGSPEALWCDRMWDYCMDSCV